VNGYILITALVQDASVYCGMWTDAELCALSNGC